MQLTARQVYAASESQLVMHLKHISTLFDKCCRSWNFASMVRFDRDHFCVFVLNMCLVEKFEIKLSSEIGSHIFILNQRSQTRVLVALTNTNLNIIKYYIKCISIFVKIFSFWFTIKFILNYTIVTDPACELAELA